MTNTIYLLSGLPRSGSTLLLNILAQNSEIEVSGTSGLYEIVHAMRQTFTKSTAITAQPEEEMNFRFRNMCREAIKGWMMSKQDGASIYIDKSRAWPAYYEFFKDLAFDVKTIITIRDLRGVLSSMEKLYRKNSLRVDPVINTSDLPLTTEERVKTWGGGVPVGSSANLIRDIFSRKIQDDFIFVRYEDLTINPEKELEQIYQYLGLDSYEHELDNIRQVTKEDDRLHGIPALHDIEPVMRTGIEDWNDVLGGELCQKIINGAPWYYDLFYKPPELKQVL